MSIAVDEQKVLAQKSERGWRKIKPLKEKALLEYNDNRRGKTILFYTSEDISTSEELSLKKSDISELSCVKEKGFFEVGRL